jgi:hypothetical protein
VQEKEKKEKKRMINHYLSLLLPKLNSSNQMW